MRTKLIITSAILAILLTASYVVYTTRTNDDPNTEITPNDQEIDYSPATEEDQEQADNIKQDLIEDASADSEKPSNNNDEPASQSETINVVLTFIEDWGENIVASAFAQTTKNGECILNMKNGGQTIQRVTDPSFNVNKYDCRFEFEQSQIGAGTYTAEVVYKIDSSENKSNALEFEVQ